MVTPGKLFASVALFWMIAVLRITDGGITFTEPAPPYTPASAELKDERTTYQRIFKGSTNVSLTWNYNISSDETISQLTWSFNGHDVARKLPSGGAGPLPGYENQYGASSSEPATLFIFNVSDDDEGKYAFKVSSSTFPPFKLLQWRDLIDVEVIEEIKITNVSDNQTPCEGSSLTLWCNATGRPMPNITWTRVWPNGSDSEVLQHDTMQNFVLSNINRSDSGTYRCAADNGVGNSINRTIDVSVDFSPTIDPLTNQTVVEGQNVTLQCQASGKPSPTVSWRTATGDLVEEANSTTLINVLRNQSEYICEASNLCGNINESVFLFVQYKPEAIQLHTTPADKVCKDGLVVFNCTADANPDVHTYQLFENDMLMGNSSTGEFNRTMSTGGNFTFKCAAINAVGTANSSAIPYTVNVPPEVQPLSNMITVVEGDNVTLFCNASGSPEPSVNWTNVNTNSITNGATRDFANINRTEAGEYKCDAQNECGSDSKSTFIIVHYPPSIVDISANQTVNESDHLALNCTADSNPQANINWTRVSDNSSVFFPLNITGKEHEGYYRCTADNSVGTPASQDVYVTVERYHPFNTQVMTTLQNNIAMVNETFNITCSAEANPPAYYVFHKNNVFLERIDAHPGVLVTSVAERVNQVDFKCIPFNDYGAGPQQEVTINVHYEPDNVVLMTNASGDTTCSGDVLNLTCTAEANPPANFVLYRDEVIEVVEVSPGVWVESMAADVHYRCAANNSVGSIGMSNNVSLTVNVASSIVPFAVNQTVTEGVNKTFYCNVTGKPLPLVSWTKIGGGQVGIGHMLNFTSINRADTGEYKCEATNECGNASAVTAIFVHYKPENVMLTANLTGNKTCHGTVVAFNCTAQANPDASTVLYQNDAMLSPVSPGIWIETLTTDGDLNFTCVANNSAGTVASNNIFVTVNVASSIESIPLDQTVTEGNSKTFHCNVSGTPPPLVSWAKIGGGQVGSGSVLTFTSINRTDAGQYKCEASNECGNATSMTSIFVHYQPENVVLTTNLTGNSTCAGTVVAFNCTAQANPDASTVLYLNDMMLSEFNPGIWIENLMTEGDLNFRCVANNSAGTGASNNLTVTVNVASSIVGLSSNKTVDEGDNVTLQCNVTGRPPPNVMWTNLDNGETKSGNDWFIQNISRTQAGAYKCEASNGCGSDSETTHVSVLYKPDNVTLTTNVTANSRSCLHAVVRLTCTADASPAPQYMLYKDNTMVPEAQSSPGVWFQTMSLEGDFQYRCVANNSRGSRESNNVTLTVYDKPSLVVPLGGNQEVNEGDNVTLYCNVSGRPEPSVNWTKVGSGVSMMVNPLVLTNINRDQAGDYKCDANNECGDATDTTTITVRYPSSIVALDNKTATKGDNITLTCNASGYPLPTVSWRKVGGGEAGNPWTIQNIGSSDAGEYICEASNSVGNDSTSVFITVQYKPEGVMLLSNVTGNKVCSGAVVNFTCTADASPSVHTYHLKENDTAVDESSSGVWLMTLSTEGNFSYSCMANNTVGTAMSASSLVVVNSAPSVVLVPDPMPWIVDGMKNLTCQVSGRPMPDVFWKKKGGARRNETVWMFSALTTDDAGEYVCTASNECGSVSKGINVTVRVSGCEQSCVDGKECRQFGGEYLCVCQVGKGGEGCNGVETPSETVTTNLRITNETWMEVYNNLEDSVTKAFTKKFEDTVLYTLRNTDANKVTVTKLSRGSVIVDFEAAFNSTHGKSEVDALLKAKSKDGTLGSYRVDSIGSASGSTPPPSTKKCGSFWEGSNCDKVKPGWLALVIIAGVVLLAFIVAIIAFCMQKQKRRGGSISTDDQNGRIGANGVSNGRAPATGAGPHARDNIAYENERYNGDGHERDTPMVTFGHAESRPEQTPGIMANDPSATKKAEPGEGTYADLGQFHSDKPAAAPATEPVVKPPVYEETAYAEITQFLKGPVKSDDDEAAETKEPGDGEEQVSVVVTEDQEDNASNNEEEPPQNIHQAIDGVIIEI